MKIFTSERISAGASVITTIITIFGLGFIYTQVKQSNTHKSWDNYNTMNNVYRQMFNQLQTTEYKGLRENKCSLNHHESAWIRSYYNLYAEEYDLDQAGLLPVGMMDETISRGFQLNLKSYPHIAKGFDQLLESGGFYERSSFVQHVKREIEKAGELSACTTIIDTNIKINGKATE